MKTNLLFFICILFALVSCEQEDKVSGEKTLAVVSASSDDRPSTRGIINDNTYALGVFRTTANTYAPLYNVKHIYSGGEWGADDVIKVDYRNASFCLLSLSYSDRKLCRTGRWHYLDPASTAIQCRRGYLLWSR